MFSPRPWGWSVPSRIQLDGGQVFPTPVGMVRLISREIESVIGFPHARGDGPMLFEPPETSTLFSPRPWGWSAGVPAEIITKHVFPTPVGMVRVARIRRTLSPGFPHARGDGPFLPEWRINT